MLNFFLCCFFGDELLRKLDLHMDYRNMEFPDYSEQLCELLLFSFISFSFIFLRKAKEKSFNKTKSMKKIIKF